MTLDLTTFILQIINFLVLLWLLHRFVYAPLRAAITRRQAAMQHAEAALKQRAQDLEADRAALQQQKAAMEKSRQQAEAQLTEELARERSKRLAALEKELGAKREQELARLETRLQLRLQETTQHVQHQVDDVLRAHLMRLASPAFEAVLLERFRIDLAALPPVDQQALRELSWRDSTEICTAFPPDEQQQRQVQAALETLRGNRINVGWKLDGKLIAGIRVVLDGKELELSLGHSLSLLSSCMIAQATVAPTT